jgi:hypothetical protein
MYFVAKHWITVNVWITIEFVVMVGAVPPIYLGVDDDTIVVDDVSVADAVLPKNDA